MAPEYKENNQPYQVPYLVGLEDQIRLNKQIQGKK